VIFVTVGTQGPFDRLLRVVDRWALETGRTDVFAQIGPSDFVPQAMDYARYVDPARFRWLMEDATAIVCHAGMGTILVAMELGKPVVVMPRRATLGEQRSEHQLATAKRFADLGVAFVAADEVELRVRLDELDTTTATVRIEAHASGELIERLRSFLFEAIGPPRDLSEQGWTSRVHDQQG
jgi:UDP-N-acetylglucosamine transferase subunit ALG13